MARPYWQAYSGTEVSTTSTSVWQTGVSLTFTPNASKSYVVFWSGLSQNNSSTVDAQVRLFDGSTALVTQNWEAQETSTPIDYRAVGGMYFFSSGGSPSSMTLSVQTKVETGSATVKLKECAIVVLELDALDATAESTGRSTTTSSTPGTKVTLNHSPGTSGDYLIVASCHTDSTAGNFPDFNFRVDTTPPYDNADNPGSKDDTNRYPWMRGCKTTWSAAAHSADIQWASPFGGTVGIEQARVLALRLSVFSAAYYAEDLTEGGGTDTTYQNVVSVTQTPAAAKHLVLGAIKLNCSSNTVSAYGQLTQAGSTLIEAVSEHTTAFCTVLVPHARAVDLTAVSTTWAFQRKAEAGSTDTFADGFIAVLQLDAGAISGSASITEAGDTLAATGGVALKGAAAIPEAGDTLAAIGALPVVGTSAITEAADTLAAAGVLPIAGTLALSEAVDTLSASGVLPIAGVLAVTEAPDTLVASGFPPPIDVTPAARAKIIALMAHPFDESVTIDLDGPPLPLGEMAMPDAMTLELAGSTTSVYAATEGFTTKPAHTPPNKWFGPHLVEPFNFGVELFGGVEPTGQQGKAGAGRTNLADPGGDLDAWLAYGWDGRALDFYRGDKGTDPATWQHIASLTAEEFTHDTLGKSFRLRDLQYRLYATTFPAATYGGAGGINGDAGLKGRVKLASFGPVNNVEPLLITASDLIYQWHFREVEEVTAVRDGASPLTFDADYPTYAALLAATVAAGHYATCNALGLIKLATTGGTPSLGLRLDGKGDAYGGYVETRGGIARRLATTIGAMALSDPGNIDEATFDLLDADQPAPCGFHANSPSGTIGSTLDSWMAGCAGYWTVNLLGMMRVGMLKAPDASAEIILARTPSLAGEPVLETGPVPRRDTSIGWGRNWAPQDVASLGGAGASGDITAAEQRLYSEVWRFSDPAQGIDDTVVSRHPGSRRVFVEGFYATQADADAEAARQKALFSTPRRRWRVPAWVDPYADVIGRTVEITGVNKLGWGSSKKLRCVGIEASASAEKTILLLLE